MGISRPKPMPKFDDFKKKQQQLFNSGGHVKKKKWTSFGLAWRSIRRMHSSTTRPPASNVINHTQQLQEF